MVVATVVGLGGVVVLGIVLAVLFLGISLDRMLGTKALFTIVLMIFSAPVSIFVLYRISTNVIAKAVGQPTVKNTTQGE